MAKLKNKATATKEIVEILDEVKNFNGFSERELKWSIGHVDGKNVYDCVRILLFKLYSTEYIINHSVSGKKVSRGGDVKERFDAETFQVLEKLVKDKCQSANSCDVTSEVHSVQRGLKRKSISLL